jgi:hypothetical protein
MNPGMVRLLASRGELELENFRITEVSMFGQVEVPVSKIHDPARAWLL